MFDLRYHVASLAAVFLALIIGILVGVGISTQTDVSGAERRVLQEHIADLERQVKSASEDTDLLQRQQEAGTEYIEKSYPAVMTGRLRGVHVALLFVGPADSGLQAALTKTLQDASGPEVTRMRALQLPVDPTTVRGALPPEFVDLAFDEIGRKLSQELIAGGDTPFWDSLAPVMVQEGHGGFVNEADAVVVAQTARIDDQLTARLISGIYTGLARGGVPVVGIERTNAQPSRIPVYQENGLASVDSVETALGRIALAVLLAGGQEGHYGIKATATDGVVPAIEPLPLAPPPGA